MARFCTQCGAELDETGQRFCGSCGAANPKGFADATKPDETPNAQGAPDAQNEPAAVKSEPTTSNPVVSVESPVVPIGKTSWWSDRRNRFVAGALGLVLVLGVGIGIALAASGGGSGTPSVSKRQASGTTTTTLNPAFVAANQANHDYISRLENILQQSSAGRGQVGTLVTGVQNGCSVSPESASAQIRTVIDNRTSVLSQLAGLSSAPNADAQNLYSLLQQALQSSINADTNYKAWMDYLYTDYYYTIPVGCPAGSPPTNDSFDNARAADATSTSLKTQFVDAFNPFASRYGLPTWDPSSF